MTPFRSREGGSHYPVHQRTLFSPPKDKVLAKRITIATRTGAHESTEYLAMRYRNADSRAEKRRLMGAAVQAMNRAQVASENPNLSPEERSQSKDVAMIYRHWVDFHRLTPKS